MIQKYQISFLIFSVILLSSFLLNAQQHEITVEEYIDTYKNIAVKKMKEYHIPASITLAQGILESGGGNSELARKAKNHFGIKCHKGWTGKTYHVDDDKKHECFRKYKNPEESYRDHSLFLTTRGRYASLFELEITDYQGWAYGLKQAGYATNPRYPQLLIRIIEENRLYQYDQTGRKRKAIPETTPAIATATTPPGLPYKLEPVKYSANKRPVYENNKVLFIIAKDGDSFGSIATEFGIYSWQVQKYNELKKKSEIKKGEILYLEHKKRKASKEYKAHTVQEGETMRDIAQLYAVKTKRLFRMNDMPKGTRPAPGQVVLLR